MSQQALIHDYLQTQALKLNADDVAVSLAATQAVLQHAQAHIEPHILQHDALPENLRQDVDNLKKLFMAIDSAYSRHAVQSAVLYVWLPENTALCRVAQMGEPIENAIVVQDDSAWQHLAARTAQSGWANVAENVLNWLDLGELQGEHNRRANVQISLPVCGEDGTIFGVLHLENTAMLPENALADWVGVVLGVLPILREMCPQKSENDDEN